MNRSTVQATKYLSSRMADLRRDDGSFASLRMKAADSG
jgi:hypothetical protein